MRRRQFILALLFVATWIGTVLHAGLEANGWIPAHGHLATHHHSGEDETHHDATGAHSEHEPVIARSNPQEGRFTAWLGLLCVPVIGWLVWLGLNLRPRALEIRLSPREPEALAVSSWQFVWRCASSTTAPPALS